MNTMKKISKICIDDVTDILNFGDGIKELTYGKEYELYFNNLPTKSYTPKYCSLINDKGISNDYYYDRFVDKAEFRNIKIKKILNE
jgi:hypothetical protein